MSMGRRQKSQSPLWIAHDEIAQSPGHRFYEKLNELLRDAAFDRHAEALCAPYYEAAHVPGRSRRARSTAATGSSGGVPSTYSRSFAMGALYREPASHAATINTEIQ